MKLRGRFVLTLSLAALVPIAVAAVVTTRVIVASSREDYEATRTQTQDAIGREVKRLEAQVAEAVTSLTSRDHPFVGNLVRDFVKGNGTLDQEAWHRLRDQGGPVMRGLSLDVLAITGPDDLMLVSPHNRALTRLEHPEVRERATKTGGKPYFTIEKIFTGAGVESMLVAEAAQMSARDGGYAVALWAGRRVGDDLLAAVRRPNSVDARIVTPDGAVLLPSTTQDWAGFSKDPPLRTPLFGPDGAPVAYIEAVVSDRGLSLVIRDITLISALLAALALGAVVVVGLIVAKRFARDMELLVEGSLAAARGDLDHRVPVRGPDEVGAVASAFNFMMEDLKTSKEKLVIAERIAAWQEIARRLAHEIKNPLTPIQMAMDTLRKSYKKQHPEFEEILDESTRTVLEEADRLKRIVAEFSDFARMPKPELSRVDLNDTIRSALALYQGAVPVTSQLAEDLPELDADKGQLTQVLLNLVENARDAIGDRDGGKISVTTKNAVDRALLVVEDNGPGVPGELKDKVFAPYFTTKHGKGGTGLGLAIVHRIVSDHGGRITISDAPGGGARFAIELPLRNGTALLASRI
ncbi:MAG: HAMP domain-containing protein [Deltaproteobacteria bacterium]|nr:HAMP domain-containing protein [Deltaproteobacteria bacterium]